METEKAQALEKYQKAESEVKLAQEENTKAQQKLTQV